MNACNVQFILNMYSFFRRSMATGCTLSSAPSSCPYGSSAGPWRCPSDETTPITWTSMSRHPRRRSRKWKRIEEKDCPYFRSNVTHWMSTYINWKLS